MLKLETKIDFSRGTLREVEIAVQRALIGTANAIRDAEHAEMQRVFDRPTRWTLGAIKVKPTAKWQVSVGILDPDGFYRRAQNYLSTQVVGGERRIKAFESALQRRGVMPTGWFAVPAAGAELDQYGNVSVGQLKQILSWFDAAERSLGSRQNMYEAGRAKRRKGTRRRRGFEYFVVMPGRGALGGRHVLHPGIYKRTTFVFGKAIKPVLLYVARARYQSRYDFERVAIDTFERDIGPRMEAEMQAVQPGGAR